MKGEAAFHLLALGRIDEAEKLCREILRGDAAGYAGVTHILLAHAALDRGDFEVVEEQLAHAKADAPAWNSIEYDVPLLVMSAEVALLQGRFTDARDAVAEGLKLAAQTDDRFFTAALCSVGIRAEADRYLASGRVRGEKIDLDRTETLERLLEEVARAETLALAPVAAHVATCRAEHSRFQGESNPEQWAEAASMWDAVDQPYRCLYARWREAEALLQARTETTRVGELLQSARDLAQSLHARVLQREIESLAERARISLGDVGAVTTENKSEWLTFGLTARELEVFALLAKGLSNKEIADELFISSKTASVHVSRILMKLGVASRVEATGIAYKSGLMEEPAG
jgi:ATP/maltotriose-dependent transcriptional regulator MalT